MAAWSAIIPVAITEVHLGCTRDEQVRWLVESWHGAHRAREAGVDVRAVTPWALLGSFDWDTLVTRAQGHYESGVFDTRSDSPRQPGWARWCRSMCSGGIRSPRPRWARLVERCAANPLWTAATGPPRLYGGRQILIAGAKAHWAGRFAGCDGRGLPVYLAGRNDLDITNAARSIDHARSRPWAVINTAGYVRVDDAESDREACCMPTSRADDACGRVLRHDPIDHLLSDLVFDGTPSDRIPTRLSSSAQRLWREQGRAERASWPSYRARWSSEPARSLVRGTRATLPPRL